MQAIATPDDRISDTVWLNSRLPLSLRIVDEMLAARGISEADDPAEGAAAPARQAGSQTLVAQAPEEAETRASGRSPARHAG